MKSLLFLVHRIPYPPNKGDKIRSFNLLKHLAQDHRIYLGAFVDDPDDWCHRDLLSQYCEEIFLAPIQPRRNKLRSLSGLLTGEALSLVYYRDSDMSRWVTDKLRSGEIDTAFAFSSTMAQYILGDEWEGHRRVIDFVDIDSQKWKQYAEDHRWPMSWLYRREANYLFNYERKSAAVSDASLFVSDAEAEAFKEMAPEVQQRVAYINNGVNTEYFSPEQTLDNPYEKGCLPIVFSGAMDYFANEDAVVWFSQQVLPAVTQQIPAIKFYIVGARPTNTVLALAALPNIVVTGTVADMRPYLAYAKICVAPMRIARGVQNKVLEAMAMARPAIVSPQGYEGIVAESGTELMVASSPEEWIKGIISLLNGNDTDRLGLAARARVICDYSWQGSLSRLNGFL